MGYEAGIRTIRFYMKSSSNVYITDENTKDSMRNTSANIEAKIFLHDAISCFPITYHNFHTLQCTNMGPLPNDSPIHGDQIHVYFYIVPLMVF